MLNPNHYSQGSLFWLVLFKSRPQSRRRLEANIKGEKDAWKYHFKWRNTREKLERKVKAGMMNAVIAEQKIYNPLTEKLSASTKKLWYIIFKLRSLKCCFLHLMCVFCKRYLTCTINMPSILNVMLEHHIGNA